MADSDESTVTFEASTDLKGATRVQVKARDFEFLIDEPESLGGTDEGPNPVEYLLGSLGGCLSIVGHVVAEEMDLEVEHLSIDLDGDLDPAKFLGHSAEERAGYQTIRASIDADLRTADGDPVNPAVKDDWLAQTEDRCPVSDNLGSETPLEINLE